MAMMNSCRRCLALGSALLLCGFGVAAGSPPSTTSDVQSAPGPHAVTTLDTVWTDASRSRTIPIRMQVPAATATGTRPTIIFSHGLGGSRAGGAVWGRHWASHGFIVIHLQHPGSDDALWRNRGTTPVKEALIAGFTPAAYVNRIADVRFAVDEIARHAAAGDGVPMRVDLARLGISGHSFGARTTLAIAGERNPGLAGQHAWSDPRFKAAVAMSPSAPGAAAGWPARFGPITIPVLSITGTRDGDPFGADMPPSQRTEPFRHMPPPHKYLLVLEGVDHFVFNGGDAPRGQAQVDGAVQRYVKMVTLAFWQAWLESDSAAATWLGEPTMRDVLAGAGTWSAK